MPNLAWVWTFFSCKFDLYLFFLGLQLKLFVSFAASSTCVKCFTAFSVHLGLEKGRRERANKKDGQITCASYKGDFSNISELLIMHLRLSYFLINSYLLFQAALLFRLAGEQQIGMLLSNTFLIIFFHCSESYFDVVK